MRRQLIAIGDLVVALVMLLVLAAPAFASYDYYIPVTVFNNSTSTCNNLTVLVSINNSQLNSLGYLGADGLDTRVLEGSLDREFMVSSNYVPIFIPSISAGQERVYNYRLGESPEQTSFPIITGGNVTISDDSDLELGGNFTLSWDMYVDPSQDGNITSKGSAFSLYIDDGNLTARACFAGNTTITSSDSDGYIYSNDSSYSTARSSASGTVVD